MLTSELKISYGSPRSRLRRLEENVSFHPVRIKFLTFKAAEKGNTESFKFRRKNVGWLKRSIGNVYKYSTCSDFGQHHHTAQYRCPQKAPPGHQGRAPGFGVSWAGRKEPSSSTKEGPSQILGSLLALGKET